MNYYDILVRGAFGNYLDLLREVTLSPLMGILLQFWKLGAVCRALRLARVSQALGEYLTFFKNSAFDHDQNYPDETLGQFQLVHELGLAQMFASFESVDC